jgi:hypothetical protein
MNLQHLIRRHEAAQAAELEALGIVNDEPIVVMGQTRRANGQVKLITATTEEQIRNSPVWGTLAKRDEWLAELAQKKAAHHAAKEANDCFRLEDRYEEAAAAVDASFKKLVAYRPKNAEEALQWAGYVTARIGEDGDHGSFTQDAVKALSGSLKVFAPASAAA